MRSNQRAVARIAVAASAAALMAVGLAAPATGAPDPVSPGTGSGNPYAPSYQHPYRHGAVPTLEAKARMEAYRAQHPNLAAPNSPLHFGGGNGGIGVTTGSPQVYLVFWGSAWGSAALDGNGDLTLSGDPFGGAPRLQEMLRGLGTGGELWSGVMTQYCDDAATGAVTCAPNGVRVAYPSGGRWPESSTTAARCPMRRPRSNSPPRPPRPPSGSGTPRRRRTATRST